MPHGRTEALILLRPSTIFFYPLLLNISLQTSVFRRTYLFEIFGTTLIKTASIEYSLTFDYVSHISE
ncbi:hypothetical protein LEP1GSC192_0564 [Leptospira sp. B5-022]|nr:hypothetical protein LEP1GSC192_0564 [Leptospira sp. B5-022]